MVPIPERFGDQSLEPRFKSKMAPIPERFGGQSLEPGPRARWHPYLRGLVNRVWSQVQEQDGAHA